MISSAASKSAWVIGLFPYSGEARTWATIYRAVGFSLESGVMGGSLVSRSNFFVSMRPLLIGGS